MSVCGAFIAAYFMSSAWMPPPEYDYEPTQTYEVRAVPCGQIPKHCLGYHAGCADVLRNVIYVDERLLKKQDWLKKLIRHERAHLNGWVHP